MTITNANFDKERFLKEIKRGLRLREEIREALQERGVDLSDLKDAATFSVNSDDDIVFKANNDKERVGVLATKDEDIRSLRELITYGLKGMAAYAEHADNLGYNDPEIAKFIRRALAATLDDSLTVDDLINLTMETGKYGVKVMALLDEANTSTYGNPEITEVDIGVRNNPAILSFRPRLKGFRRITRANKRHWSRCIYPR